MNRKTGKAAYFGPYETEAIASAAANAGRRRGGNVGWLAQPLHAPAEGGDPHGAFVVCVGDLHGALFMQISGHRYLLMVDASGPQLTGPFSTSAAARAWMRKNKIDRSHGHVTTLMLEIDEATANWLWIPKSLKRRVWV
jgi:hypothetical protein